jgi:magnesium-transporting ATPase (P-type)
MVFSVVPHADQNNLAITVYYAGVVMAQVGNAFASRTERNRGRSLGWLSNPSLLRGIAIELAILLALVYFPPLAHLFDHAPIPAVLWVGLITFPVIIYSLDWIRKWFVRWRERFSQNLINNSVSKEEL